MSHIKKFFLASVFLFNSVSVLALDSICGYGYIFLGNYNTVWHEATWEIWDFYTPYDTAYARTQVWGPNGVFDEDATAVATGSGGTIFTYLQNPRYNGYYEIYGSMETFWYNGYYDELIVGWGCSNTFFVQNTPTVQLTGPGSLTLNDDFTAGALISPSFLDISNYKFEIRRDSSVASWFTVSNGASSSISTYAKVAGTFKWRLTVTASGANYTSSEGTQTIQFMSYNDLLASSVVQAATLSEFNTGITNSNSLGYEVERGFWITFNSGTRAYGKTTTLQQPPPIILGTKPSDSITAPNPLDSVVYTIASFHTHPPPTGLPSGFCTLAGPSGADADADTADQVTGVVYAWDADYCVNAPVPPSASLQHSGGPDRRPTP